MANSLKTLIQGSGPQAFAQLGRPVVSAFMQPVARALSLTSRAPSKDIQGELTKVTLSPNLTQKLAVVQETDSATVIAFRYQSAHRSTVDKMISALDKFSNGQSQHTHGTKAFGGKPSYDGASNHYYCTVTVPK